MEAKTLYTKYKIRTCRTLHFCAICQGRIEYGQKYYDGGYGKRTHDLCAEANELEERAKREAVEAATEFYKPDAEEGNDDEGHTFLSGVCKQVKD